MAFVNVLKVKEIPVGTKKKVVVNGTAVMIANVGDKFYAMDDKCPHMGGSLSEGKLEGNIISCPVHHASFDVTNGKAEDKAKIAFIKMKVKDGRSIPVKVEGEDILVDLE